jgi:uncharacterized protein involved in outer membrane biogenesis
VPRNRLLAFALALLGLIVVLGGIGVAALLTIDFRPIIERQASRALQRPLTIGALEIGWGDPLRITLHDVHLANMAGGSEPDMVTVGRLEAAIELWPLLHGALRYDRLRLEGARILLERNAKGEPNWRFPSGGSGTPGGLALVPKDRSQFPTLLDAAAKDATLVYRVPQHRDITIAFGDLTLGAAGDDAKARLAMKGAYNGVAAQLDVTGGSFAMLRDAEIPYPAEIALKAAPMTLALKGALTDPLDFDGVTGALDLDTPDLGAFLKVIGAELRFDAGLHLDGAFARTGDRWHLGDAKGALASSMLTGAIDLDEGPRGGTDALALALAFATLDLRPLITALGSAGTPLDETSLRLDEHPGVTITARITAKQLADGTLHLADVTLRGAMKPGAAELDALSFPLAGGEVTAKGSAQTVAGGGSRIAADLAWTGADTDALLRLAGEEPGQIAGRVDASAALDMTGRTLGEALPTLGGQAVLAMTGGRIARALVEKASTDLRSLFRSGEGFASISCLIGIASIEHGVARIAPLRLQTADTSFLGGGWVNLVSQHVDLTVRTEGGPSFFALRLPLHVSGPLTQPSISPQFSAADVATAPPRLVPAVQPTAAGNACLR